MRAQSAPEGCQAGPWGKGRVWAGAVRSCGARGHGRLFGPGRGQGLGQAVRRVEELTVTRQALRVLPRVAVLQLHLHQVDCALRKRASVSV